MTRRRLNASRISNRRVICCSTATRERVRRQAPNLRDHRLDLVPVLILAPVHHSRRVAVLERVRPVRRPRLAGDTLKHPPTGLGQTDSEPLRIQQRIATSRHEKSGESKGLSRVRSLNRVKAGTSRPKRSVESGNPGPTPAVHGRRKPHSHARTRALQTQREQSVDILSHAGS